MSCIHYKFKSSLDYNSVTFDGLHLSLGDLKKAISTQKRLKQGEFELEIINAQTGDVYKKSDELIAKNTSVIVSRVPVTKTNTTSTQRSWEAFKQECAKVKQQERDKMLELEMQKKAAEAITVPSSEMDKIKAVIDQSTKGFEPSSFQGRNPHAIPHDHYVCKRCGNKGHYILNCPNIKQEDRVIEPRVKRTTGIPSTMLTIVDDPLHPGALLTHHGQFAVPTVDVEGYRDSKKDLPPFSGEKSQPEVEKKIIPKELLCHICEDLCVDAAIAPCCGTSFCDECLREELLESEDHQCPSCHETNVSPDRIVANRSMRIAVTNFLNDTGYSKVKRRRSSSTSGEAGSIFAHTTRPPSPPPPPPQPNAASPPSQVSQHSGVSQARAEAISSLVDSVPSSSIATTLGTDTSGYPGPSPRDTYQPRSYRGGHNSYKPWHHQEPPISWNGGPPLTSLQQPPTFVSATPPAPVMAAAAAVASRAIQALVGQRLPLPHLMPPNFPGLRGFPPMAPRPMGLGRYPAASPPKRKAVDVFDSFADFTKKRSRTPELRSRSRSRSGSRPRRSSHSSYSPAKKGSRGRSPRRSSLSRSRSPSRTGSFKRSRSRGRSPKRSRSKTPPRRRRTGSAESRGLSELRSISPESAKRSKSRSRSPRPLLRSRSRSRSYKRSYRSRSRSWSKSKKVQSRSYSPLSPKPLRRSPDRSPRRSPRRSPYRSPGRSPLYSPVRSRSRRSFTPRRRSRSFSPRRKSPARSKSRSPFNKRRPTYSRSKSPVHTRKRSPSPYNKARRSPSPYSKAGGYSKKKSPSPYQYRGGYRERDSKYPREDRGSGPSARPRLSPPRRPSGPGNAPPPPAHPNAAANLPPVQLLPNMALPPPEEYFKHNPAGYEEFLRTFYAQVGNQGTPWGGAPQGGHPPPSHPPPGPHFGNSYPPAGPLNGPPVHPHSGFPQDRRPPPWNSGGPPPLRPRSVSPIGRMAPPSPKYGDRYRRDRDTTRPGLDGRGIGRDKDRRFDDHRFGGDRNTRRGADSRDDDHRQEDRRWRGDFKDKRPEEGKDRKVIHSEIRDKRGPREGEKRGRDGDKTRNVDKSKDGQKSKERLSTEKRKSPQNASKQQEKSRKGEDRRKKEEKENVESKPKSDASDKASEVKKAEAIDINGDSALAGHGKPLDDLAQAKKDDMPDGTNNSRQPSQDNGEKEKKAPGKKKVGAAGKKLKTKGGNAVDGEKKEKKIKKKKLTFGASEADNKGLKKKKLKRVVDYKSENTGTSEDAVDLEKGILAEPSPVKRAKFEAMEDGDLAAEKMEFAEDVDPSKNVPMPNDCLETPERAMPVGEEKEVSWPSSPDKPKSGLMTELPELSKWERDDDFDLPVVEKAEEKHKEKPSLPRSVVDKAEMFLVGKPMKNSVVAAPVPSIDTIPEAADKQKDVQDKPRPMADKEKYGREAAPLRPKERDASDRHSRGGSDRRRMSQDERREEVCDSRRKDPKDYRVKSPIHPGRDYNRSGGNNNSNKDYRSKSPGYNNRPKSPNFHKDLRAKSPVHGKDYRSKSPIHNKDYRSKSPIHNKDYRSKSPIHNKDYRSKSPIHNKDYRSKSPIHNKDYRSKSPIHNKDYRSKSPIHNKDYRSKSPIHNKDYRSKSPAHPKDYKSKSPSDQRSRKVSIDSKKDHREKRDYDIKITVKGDRESKKGGGDQERPTKKGGGDQERPTKKGGGDQAHKYQDRGDLSDEDERSVVRSHSLERELKTKTKGQKAQREEGAKSHDKRKNEKDASSTWPKSKRSKKGKPVSEDKDSGTPAGSGTTTTTTCKKESQARGGKEDSGPHRSPRDLRHKIEEKTKGQTKSQNASTHHQRKLSVMDEAEFVPDYEDTLGHEGAGAGGGEDKGRPSVSPSWPDPKEGGGGKGKGESSEKSSEEEEGGGSEEVKEGKKHKKSKKKHKHKDKKEKKEKHKQKKKKKHKKNKEEED